MSGYNSIEWLRYFMNKGLCPDVEFIDGVEHFTGRSVLPNMRARLLRMEVGDGEVVFLLDMGSHLRFNATIASENGTPLDPVLLGTIELMLGLEDPRVFQLRGFYHGDFHITNPFFEETGRFEVDPVVYYGEGYRNSFNPALRRFEGGQRGEEGE